MEHNQWNMAVESFSTCYQITLNSCGCCDHCCLPVEDRSGQTIVTMNTRYVN